MTIHYSLMRNRLVNGINTYFARFRPNRVLDEKDMVSAIVGMGSSLTAFDVQGVINAQTRFIIENLLAGNAIRLPYGLFSVGICGNFKGSNDGYDPQRHKIHAKANAGVEIKRALKRLARVEKTVAGVVLPAITAVEDIESGEVNGKITAGGIANIVGQMMKYDSEDPTQGFFFVARDGSESKVHSIALNSPKHTSFSIPADLQPGTYSLILRVGVGKEQISGRTLFDLFVT